MDAVERHYGRGGILDAILSGLRALGKDPARLEPVDLAPVDEFHIRGREATVELADRAGVRPGLRVLDVGSGLGGSLRYLAAERGCSGTGIDVTQEYVEAARALAELVKLGHAVEFRQGSALEVPFADGSFELAWTEHAQMNIADKPAFYGQLSRVLVPGGRLVFHDIFQGEGGPVHVPVPWADERSISFLARPALVREILQQARLRIVDWEDKTRQSLEWFVAVMERLKQSGPPPLGFHLLMGSTARVKLENMIRNLQEQRIVVIQAVAEKT